MTRTHKPNLAQDQSSSRHLRKEAITRLSDAIYLVRTTPEDPFDADLAFGLMCAWTVMLLMDHIDSGKSQFTGDISIHKYADFGALLDKLPVSDHAHQMAQHAASQLLGTMAKHTPFKNVLAKARLDLIKRRGVRIKADWCKHGTDRAHMKALCDTQWSTRSCMNLQFNGSASGAMCLEALTMITEGRPQQGMEFNINVHCEDHTSLLIAIVQLMFASLLHTFASVKLRFYHKQDGRTDLLFEFDYTPRVWGFELVAA